MELVAPFLESLLLLEQLTSAPENKEDRMDLMQWQQALRMQGTGQHFLVNEADKEQKDNR